MPIIVRPAPDHRAEVADYLAGRGLPMLAQIVSNAAQVPHQFGLLRSRQDHAAIASHGEAEEVEAFIDMNNSGLRFTQFQPLLSQKGRELGNDVGRQGLSCRCRHHRIIGISDQTDPTVAARALAWLAIVSLIVFSSEEPLHAVERHIRQQRREHSTHNGAKLPFDLTITIPRDRLRPHYRDGFAGAPLMACRPCNPHRPGHGGADAPAQNKLSPSHSPGEP